MTAPTPERVPILRGAAGLGFPLLVFRWLWPGHALQASRSDQRAIHV